MTGAVISSLAIKRAHPLNLREETLPSAAPASRRRRFDGARERLNCPGDLAAAVGRGLCGGGDRRFIPQPRMGVNMMAAAPPAWDQLDGETLREEFALRGIAIFSAARPTAPWPWREALLKVLKGALSCLCAWLGAAAPAFAACELTRAAQVPLFELGAHYAVTAAIDGRTRPMIVDTGAEVTLIKSSVAKELDLTPDSAAANARPVLGIGQTQADVFPNVIPSVLAFGDLAFRDRSTVVALMDDGATPESESAGLLGDDILSQFDVEFDFPGGKLTFYRAFGCYNTFLPWTGAYSAIPFAHRGAKIAIDVMIDNERTPTIVDTGNNVSFVSRDATALSGVRDSDLIKTSGRARSPLNNGTSLPIRQYAFDTLKIGDERLSHMKIGVIDVDFAHGSANLGLDFWKTRKVWISYRNALMFVSDGPAAMALAYPVTDAAPTSAGAGAKGDPGSN